MYYLLEPQTRVNPGGGKAAPSYFLWNRTGAAEVVGLAATPVMIDKATFSPRGSYLAIPIVGQTTTDPTVAGRPASEVAILSVADGSVVSRCSRGPGGIDTISFSLDESRLQVIRRDLREEGKIATVTDLIFDCKTGAGGPPR